MLNARAIDLLRYILQAGHWVSYEELGAEFEISNRTVRYEVKKINDYLSANGLPPIRQDKNKGLSCESAHTFEVVEQLAGKNSHDYILSRDERVAFMLCRLLMASGYITIQALSEELDVSRGTAVSDMVYVRQYLNDNNLKAASLQNRGIRIEGSDSERNQVLTRLLRKNLSFKNPLSNLRRMFPDIELQHIEEFITSVEDILKLQFSDEAYLNLALHVLMGIKRTKTGKPIQIERSEMQRIGKMEHYTVTKRLYNQLAASYQINFPEEETASICSHIKNRYLKLQSIEQYPPEFIMSVNLFMIKVSQGINYNFVNDKTLFFNLLSHLFTAITPLADKHQTEHPLLAEIKTKYRFLFMCIRKNAPILESYFGFPISEDDIGFITVHFRASMEIHFQKHYRKNILLVCGSGGASVNLLKKRLKELYLINIVDAIPYRKLHAALDSQMVDLIITTLPLSSDEYYDIPVVRVSGMINGSDEEDLNKYLEPAAMAAPKIRELIRIIRQNCEITNRDGLTSGLKKLLKLEEIEGRLYDPMLNELLTAPYIHLQADAADCREAVRIAGNILYENGNVELSYVDAMLRVLDTFGAYIVIAPGIAMPHAKPEDGVKKVGVSLVTLKHPVTFGNAEHDPVSIILAICSKDHSSHLSALSELVEYLRDEAFIRLVNQARDCNQILEYIHASGGDD